MMEKLKKFIKSRKGQIGPMSLEDIPSLTIMLMMTMIFIVLIFKIVGGYLEVNRAADMHNSAVELANILETKSELVYVDNSGVRVEGELDPAKFSSFDLNKYLLAEYETGIQIKDVETDQILLTQSTSSPVPDERIVVNSPCSLSNGHFCLMKITIWRE